MKNLNRKIGIGVLIAALLVGGGSLSNGVVSHANSNISNSLLEPDLIELFLSGLEPEVAAEFRAFIEGDYAGLLKHYSDNLLKELLKKLENRDNSRNYEELLKSVFNAGKNYGYSVIGAELDKKMHFIPVRLDKFDEKRSSSLSDFLKDARSDFRKLKLEKGKVYQIFIDGVEFRLSFL